MEIPELIKALRRNMVETGSLVCLGCGHEHSCSTRGCAIIREAADALEKQIPQPLLKKGSYTRACPRCGTLYGLSGSRVREDTQYCDHCGQLTSGWNDAIKKNNGKRSVNPDGRTESVPVKSGTSN